ncbi:MAG: dephospho-CoA kinase [Propionibacteriaceae bacterium]|jgi:dephospho-CoA kinase|nr:dephospho-CoA kinase [Propionibacteriaceae bacterium]
MRKLRVALSGGIASGKSLVAGQFAEHGAVIVDTDVLAREVVAPGTLGLEAIVARFGAGVLSADGTLDRAALGEIVFDDDQARADINAITHPLIRDAEIAADAAAPEDAIVVHVIPLLVETGQQASFDKVIVIDSSYEAQVSRLMNRNSYNRMQAKKRVAAQATREERIAVADYVIDNEGSIPETLTQVESVWTALREAQDAQ